MGVAARPGTLAQPIRSALPDLDAKRVEPSGVISAQAPGQYLVVSDEASLLLTMDQSGEIVASKPVTGVSRIDDIESISRSGQFVIVAGSLSFARDGTRKPARCQMQRLRETDTVFVATASIDLCATLQSLAETSDDVGTRAFLRQAIARREVDVEALGVQGDRLYLGFKTPLDGLHRTVILEIDAFHALLAGASPQGRIWQRVMLQDPQSGKEALLSDMVMRANDVLLLAISHHRNDVISHLWALRDGQLRELATLPGLNAEGVGDQVVNDHLLVVTDGGGRHPPQYLSVKVGA
jgi:hypothetical protein